VVVYRQEQRAWMRPLAVWALIAVIAQGCLGGARVLLVERQLAMLHGCIGPAFFAYCLVLCAVTSRWWHQAAVTYCDSASRLHVWVISVALLAYFQLVLGALLRHVPESASTLYFEVMVWAHLIGAGVLITAGIAVAWRMIRSSAPHPGFRSLSVILVFLIFAQLVLGGATWVMNYHWPTLVVRTPLTTLYTVIEAQGMLQSVVATAHAANGSLVLGVAVLLAARALRLVRPALEMNSAAALAPSAG
jgi:heme a synthase